MALCIVVQVEELFVERAHDAPLCIVTPDFSENEHYRAPPIEDDPFENIGFITAFSTWSLEQAPLFTTTTTSFSGQLAELERVLSDSLYTNGGSLGGASMSMTDTLRAYFQIMEVSSILGLERDSCDHAIQLFRDCLATTYLRNRNIEALATAALVQAVREAQEPRTLQEISAAANIPQKEIGRHMKVLGDALKLSQPINSNSISVHMPRFCNLLQLSKTTQDLATHIGEVVINKSFCTRRNPISISAAAIYLSCQLEDKRKTQTEICKATGLTEVTLRKVYKELLENLDDLLPPNYTPAVPLEKAFPVNAAALGRVHIARAVVVDPAVPMAPYNSAVSNNSSGLAADTSSGVGGSRGSSPAHVNVAQGPVSGIGSTDRASVSCHGSTPPSSDGRPGMHMFTAPNPNTGGVNGGEAFDRKRINCSKDIERDCNEWEREKDRDQDRLDSDSRGPNKKVNMMSLAAPVPGFQPSFFPFAQIDPRIFQEMNPGMWPLRLYGPPATAMRKPEDGAHSTQGSDTGHDDELANSLTPSVEPPQQQYVSLLPGKPEDSNASMQLKMLQLVHAPPEPVERHAMFEGDHNTQQYGDHDTVMADAESQNVSAPNPGSKATIPAFAVASARSQVFTGLPPGLWPYVTTAASGPYGIFHPELLQTQGVLNHSAISEKKLEDLPHALLPSAGAEALSRMTGPGVGAGQAIGLDGQNHMTLSWPGTPFHPLYLPANMNVGHGQAGVITNDVCDVANGPKGDGGGGGIDGNSRLSAARQEMNLPHQSSGAMSMSPLLSMGGSHGPQGGSGIPPVLPKGLTMLKYPPCRWPW